VRRIKWREHTPIEVWMLAVLMLVFLLFVIPRLIESTVAEHAHRAEPHASASECPTHDVTESAPVERLGVRSICVAPPGLGEEPDLCPSN
jgi:hypothetical protein